MTKEECAEELQKISSKVYDLSRDINEDKYATATEKIKSKLNQCIEEMKFVISNIE